MQIRKEHIESRCMAVYRNWLVIFLLLNLIGLSCRNESTTKSSLFRVLDHTSTGIDFRNDLVYTKEFNLFKYMYFYNGSGVGAGDFNNDGKIDLLFGSNQGRNRLYLNKGQMKFDDVTEKAGLPDDQGWTTGISVVDINNDGLLDVYICRVGNFETLRGKNLLLINKGVKDGIPNFSDEAKQYGLDFSGFSTQAAFLDYDLDGDLDMFLMNHSVHQNGTFKPRNEFLNTFHPLSGDRFFRNDNGRFTDITREVGIQSSAIGYGLGIVVSDINLDGYPDIYIGNDFHENDYLYINQGNGRFTEECTQRMMHTSQYSMGVDAADVNNDGWPEIISADMLPSDAYILKRSLGEDSYDIFNFKIRSGYGYQYTRNNLQYNRGNGIFSEIGLYSGVAATDWSWAPLWIDFNNDGRKDLFVSNGIPKRMNDIDYINFISNSEIQQKINSNSMDEKNMSLINKFPQIKLPNKFYLNKPGLEFEDVHQQIDGDKATYSNGSAYADFDNDGDLDIVVNNIDADVLVYENQTAKSATKTSVAISLIGPTLNRNALGSRLVLFAGNEIRTYDKNPARGFISSMEIPMLIGLSNTKVDSAFLIWPDNSFQAVTLDPTNNNFTLQYHAGLPKYDFSKIREFHKKTSLPVADITAQTRLVYRHSENRFSEFDREGLLPHMFSTEGPALAVGDMNRDGLDDIFIGSARNQPGALFLQQQSGKFIHSNQPAFQVDSAYEATDAVWTDVNNDGFLDLIVASGGNEFYGTDAHNLPRLYINEAGKTLTRKDDAFHDIFLTASTISVHDFTGDGFADLFIGAKTVPWDYGMSPRSYLMANDGSGHFTDVTSKYGNELSQPGFVTQSQWIDMNGDGVKDLVCSFYWDSPAVFIMQNGKFARKNIGGRSGWWNFMLPCDIDKDGDLDFIAGNLGLNSRLHASAEKPVRLYYNDFDDNGRKEQVLTYFINDKELPFANKAELEKQMPVLKKRYLYAENFAKATIPELFTGKKMDEAKKLSADYFANAVFINQGNLNFEVRQLPVEAQLSQMRTAIVVQANDDQWADILIMGNYYENNIEMGRYDADYGTLLLNDGKGGFRAELLNGLLIKGQVRHISNININQLPALVLACNSDSTRIIQFKKSH